MGFREGAFATVWEITNQGDSFSKVRVSTSRKAVCKQLHRVGL